MMMKKLMGAFFATGMATSVAAQEGARQNDGLVILGVIDHQHGGHYFSGAPFDKTHAAKSIQDDSYVLFGIHTLDEGRNDKVFEQLSCGAIRRWNNDMFGYLQIGFSTPERLAGTFRYFNIQADPKHYDPAVMSKNAEKTIQAARALCDPQIS